MKTNADKTDKNTSQSAPNADTEILTESTDAFQFVDNRPHAITQRKQQKAASSHAAGQHSPIQKKENKTGLPDDLKSGVENLSGISMDDVKVHRNSAKPAQLEAHAYAQGSEIHLGPGQEKHLPHEAWHVVQQKQGRVSPTLTTQSGIAVNDDSSLESEADTMGAQALQLKKIASNTTVVSTSSHIVQRSAETDMTDSRMNDLVQRVLEILSTLKAQGKNWEAIYDEKGKKAGKDAVGKVKDKVLGKKSKKGPSFKEKIIKEALKRWWNSIPAEEKVEVISEIAGESVGVISKMASGLKGLFSKEPTEEEKEEKEAEQERQFDSFLSRITLEDVENGYEAFKAYRKISAKLKEFEDKSVELASQLGGSVGTKVGEIRNEKEFIDKFKEQRKPHTVARLEYEFLKESITDKTRYKDELDALSDALDTRLNGPSGMIYNTKLFSSKEQMQNAHESCSIAYDNLKLANIFRNTTTSGLSNVKNWFKKTKDRLAGKSESDKTIITNKQAVLTSALETVCNKKWNKFTGLFASTPNGVKQVKKELAKDGSDSDKLAAIKENLVKPERELAETEERLTTVDSEMSKTASGLKSEVTEDKLLSKTRTVKSTEKYGSQVAESSGKALSLGAEKVELELKKRDLKKQLESKNRHALTQLFYNTLKNMDPDNIVSLGKTTGMMNQIAAELDSPELTKKI